VYRNRLYSIPASLLRLPDLRTLSASHNQLVAISSDLSSLQQLEALNMHHNRMTALPDTLGERLPIIPPAPVIMRSSYLSPVSGMLAVLSLLSTHTMSIARAFSRLGQIGGD